MIIKKAGFFLPFLLLLAAWPDSEAPATQPFLNAGAIEANNRA